MAKLRDEAVFRAMKSGGAGKGYHVKKSGDATAVLVGFPSTVKSTLLSAPRNRERGGRVLFYYAHRGARRA